MYKMFGRVFFAILVLYCGLILLAAGPLAALFFVAWTPYIAAFAVVGGLLVVGLDAKEVSFIDHILPPIAASIFVVVVGWLDGAAICRWWYGVAYQPLNVAVQDYYTGLLGLLPSVQQTGFQLLIREIGGALAGALV